MRSGDVIIHIHDHSTKFTNTPPPSKLSQFKDALLGAGIFYVGQRALSTALDALSSSSESVESIDLTTVKVVAATGGAVAAFLGSETIQSGVVTGLKAAGKGLKVIAITGKTILTSEGLKHGIVRGIQIAAANMNALGRVVGYLAHTFPKVTGAALLCGMAYAGTSFYTAPQRPN